MAFPKFPCNLGDIQLIPLNDTASNAKLADDGLSNSNQNCGHTPAAAQTLASLVQASDFILFLLVKNNAEQPATKQLLEALHRLLKAKSSDKDDSASLSGLNSPSRARRLLNSFIGKNGNVSKSSSSCEIFPSLRVVVLNLDGGAIAYESALAELKPHGVKHFYQVAPPIPYSRKALLLRYLRFVHAPTIVVLDTHAMSITTSQGRGALAEDPKGVRFPWRDPPLTSILQEARVLKRIEGHGGISSIKEVDFSSLQPGVKGLYFAARWCPPCSALTRQLKEIYEQIKKVAPTFELYLCSLDRGEAAFDEHFSTMPWVAFSLPTAEVKALANVLDVNGIPALVLLDENNEVLTQQGRNQLLSDPQGREFPWKRLPIYELKETTVHRIAEFPTLILFTEGSPGDNEFARQMLQALADEVFAQLTGFLRGQGDENRSSAGECSMESSNSAVPLQLFYTGEDPICDHLLESVGQADADLPLIMIIDSLLGHMAICEEPDVSSEVVRSFIAAYTKGEARVVPLQMAASSPHVTTDLSTNGRGSNQPAQQISL